MLAALDARYVIPGHGEPFTGVAAAIDRAFQRTAAFEADMLRNVRHALKVLLTFALLDRERMPLASMPEYVDRIGIHRDFNARFFGLSPREFAERLVADARRLMAIELDGDDLVPARRLVAA
jgi:hypothetical protein